MAKVVLWLETLTCPSCLAKIEGAVGQLNGVKDVKVLFNASKVKVEFNEADVTTEEIKGAVERLGYSVDRIKTK